MTAFACLRILSPPELHSRPGLEGLINRYACSFLETRWCWPRRFEVMSLSCFLLADPREATLDPRTVQDLAYDLQLRLFGSGGAGQVELIVFEGESSEVVQFAGLDQHEVRKAARGEQTCPAFVGRLTRVTAADIQTFPSRGPGDLAPATADQSARSGPGLPTPAFQGLYFAAKDTFVGSFIGGRESGYNIADGLFPKHRDQARHHDRTMIALTVELLRRQPSFAGMFYVPICYAPLIHRQERQDYLGWLNALPQGRRNNLAVSVYDTPRDPSFSALSQIRAFLEGYFKVVDLLTLDPDFAVERLAPGAVQSVTLVLPEASQLARIAAIRRFAGRIDLFRQRRIWPAVTNVRNAVELETCLARRIPFVSGRTVTATLTHPVGVQPLPVDNLPLDDRMLREAAAPRTASAARA